jgi:hypothetical protein
MVCWPWWVVGLVLAGAAAAGFVLCFLWHWWLVSRPGARNR